MPHVTAMCVPKFRDFPVTKPLFCGPGPCDMWPSVIAAMSKPVISPQCEAYHQTMKDIREGCKYLFLYTFGPWRIIARCQGIGTFTDGAMKDIREGCKYLFQTKSEFVLAVSGSGHAGMEAVITNLVAPRQTMLIAARGMWDARAEILATRHGCNVAKVSVPMEQTFSLDIIEPHLKKLRPAALFITHGDSSTGTVQNLVGLGDLCHKYGTLLLVDTVVSIGAEPFFMDEWAVDAVYAALQKSLSGPAGISPVAFSKRAQKVIFSREFEPPFYLDCKALAEQWSCFKESRVYHHTLSPPLIWALHACLQQIIKKTLEKSWSQHKMTQLYFHKKLQELDFDLLVPKSDDRLSCVTTVKLPMQYDEQEFVKFVREKHGIIINPGLGPSAGKALRIGFMGINARPEAVDVVVHALVDARNTLNKSS